MNPWNTTEKKSLILSGAADTSLVLCWSTYWHVSWRCNFRGTRSPRDISGQLVPDISKLSRCRCSHCCRWWNHCSFAASSAYAKAPRSEHCSCRWQGALGMGVQPPPQGQRKGSCSEAAFTSPTVQFCPMLRRSLWARSGFQSSFASIQRLSVCLRPRLPNWSSLSHYFPNQLYGSEFASVLNLVHWEPGHFVTKCPYRDHQILQLGRRNVLK